jgi:teichuronic acid biosynthesis glycosyltransferase TuaC
MRHDVIKDRYARLYEQPYQLALLGNNVLGICLSYSACKEIEINHDASPGSLSWIGLSPGKTRFGLISYYKRCLRHIESFKPDIIVGASDSLHIILAEKIASKLNIKFCADLYDHFETFGLSKIPFVTGLYIRALRKAAIVSCVSESLAKLVRTQYAATGNVIVLRSTVNQAIFHPRNKIECRRKLNLPVTAKLIGTAGALTEDRGIKPVYEAFLKLSEECEDVYLVLAGILDKKCPPPSHARVIFLGQLPHEKIAELFSALDIGIIYINDTEYGRYSFPQKAFEMIASQIPIVAPDIGDLSELLSTAHQNVYLINDSASIKTCLFMQLKHAHIEKHVIESWGEQAQNLQSVFQTLFR